MTKPDLIDYQTCTYIDYYSCAGTADDPYQYCSYSFTVFLGCVEDPDDGGGGGGSVNVDDGSAVSSGGSPTTPNPANYGEDAGPICGGGYNWTTVGNAWCTQFAPMIFQMIYQGSGPLEGTIEGYTIQQGCWTIPKARAATKQAADQWVNQAWNYASSQAPVHANAGNGISNSSVIRAFTADVNAFFKANGFGTSASFNPTGCGPTIPTTPAPAPCLD